MPKRIAAIDLGSNAVRLIVADLRSDGTIGKDSSYRVPLRIGGDVFSSGLISAEKIVQLVTVFQAFRHLLSFFEPVAVRACATSAMREARNAAEVQEKIRIATGIQLEVISGDEEARLLFSNHFEEQLEADRDYLYIDVGGGSTEISFLHRGKAEKFASFRVGAVRALVHGVNDSESAQEWERMKSWVKDLRLKEDTWAIATGGNIGKLKELAGTEGNSRLLSRKALKEIVDRLAVLPYEERLRAFDLKPDRADVIVPAGQIYSSVLKWADIKTIVVPMLGVSDGILRDLARKYMDALGSGNATQND